MAFFSVGDGVFANVPGFEPFPAVVESVVFNESSPCIYYHIKLLGSKQVVALDSESLLPFEENKAIFKINYSTAELENGAKMRESVLLGKDDEFPEVLMNLVTVENQFEEVSSEDMKKLGLSNIILSASDLIRNIEKVSTPSLKEENQGLKQSHEDELIDIEEVSWHETQAHQLQNQVKEHMTFTCNICFRNFRAIGALRRHKQLSLVCKNLEVRKQERQTMARRKKKMLTVRKAKPPVNSAKKQSTEDNFDISSIALSSASDDSLEEKDAKHSLLERERRAQLAGKFTELARTVGLEKDVAKVGILAAAKCKIRELKHEEGRLQTQMTQLKDINLRLNARLLSLSC